MKGLLVKILSVFMSLLVLFSTFSFTFSQHFCGGVLVDFAVFSKAESCGMEIQQPSESHENHFEKTSCCEDDTVSVIGQQDLKPSLEKISIGQLQFVFSFVCSYLNLLEETGENSNSFSPYPPPLLVKEIHLLDQTFLI